jgi:RNA polymerase sigma factor (sigma-70 family)
MAMLPVQAPPEQEPVREIRPRLTGSSHRGLASRADERLVTIAKEGDERAFEVLYERHSPAILRYCRSLLRSTQESEDVTQEVFVLAISALRRGAEPEMFRPWLYRVAHNACMSHLRMRRPVLVADNGVLVGPAAAAEPVQHHREELRQLLDDIGTLPDVQRGALLLREMDGFSYEQVGEVLGLPLSTVRASIFRARRTLQGLAAARDADCEAIQSELSDLADRRGRRGRHITSHLTVCASCRDFREGLRRRPAVLGGVAPAGPLGPGALLLLLKGKLVGGATASGGAGSAIATASGGAGAAKIAAVAASSVALLAGAGVEADRVIENGRRDAAVTPRHALVRAVATRAGSRAPGRVTTRITAAGITFTGPDGVREVRAFGGHRAPVPGTTLVASSRAHARVKADSTTSEAAPAAPAPAAPRAATPAAAAPEARHSSATGDDRDGRGEPAGTTDRDHGSDRGEGSRKRESDSGATRPGGHDGEHASQRSDSGNDGHGSRPAPNDDSDDTAHTQAPSRAENAGPPPPRRPAADEPPDTTETSPSTGTQAPIPAPAPSPEPPADPAPDPASPADASAPATGDAGTAGNTAATTADPAAVTPMPQP